MSQKKTRKRCCRDFRSSKNSLKGNYLKDIEEACTKKVKFHVDQKKTSLQEKENSMPWYNKKYIKVNERKARKQFIYALKLFDTLVTPICSIKLWGFKGLKKLEKQTDTRKFYKFIFSVKQSTANNFVYEELVRRPCQFMFR